jgi:hypothetical protein
MNKCNSHIETPKGTDNFWRSPETASCIPVKYEDQHQLTVVFLVIRCTGHGEDYFERPVRVHHSKYSADRHALDLTKDHYRMVGRYDLVMKGLQKWWKDNPAPPLQYTKTNKVTTSSHNKMEVYRQKEHIETGRLHVLYQVPMDWEWSDCDEVEFKVQEVPSEIDYSKGK